MVRGGEKGIQQAHHIVGALQRHLMLAFQIGVSKTLVRYFG